MCGIVGLYVKKDSDSVRTNIEKLLMESSVRGLHSFGYAAIDVEDKIVVKKYFNLSNMIINMRIHQRMIFHNRYSTSGDYKIQDNNQPISNGKIALVFNGVIDMGNKSEMESRHGIKMATDNDGEIVLQKIDLIESVTSKGSFAGLFLMNGMLHHYRNKDRPCHFYEDDHAIYFASTADIFKRAMDVQSISTTANMLWKF